MCRISLSELFFHLFILYNHIRKEESHRNTKKEIQREMKRKVFNKAIRVRQWGEKQTKEKKQLYIILTCELASTSCLLHRAKFRSTHSKTSFVAFLVCDWVCCPVYSCCCLSVSRPTRLFSSVNSSTHRGTLGRHQPSLKQAMCTAIWRRINKSDPTASLLRSFIGWSKHAAYDAEKLCIHKLLML